MLYYTDKNKIFKPKEKTIFFKINNFISYKVPILQPTITTLLVLYLPGAALLAYSKNSFSSMLANSPALSVYYLIFILLSFIFLTFLFMKCYLDGAISKREMTELFQSIPDKNIFEKTKELYNTQGFISNKQDESIKMLNI